MPRHAHLADLNLALPAGQPQPDWVLTDHRLPDGHEWSAIARLQTWLGPVQGLLIIGDTAPEVVARFAKLGLDVLHKSFVAEALLRRADRWSLVCRIGTRRQHRRANATTPNLKKN